VTIDTTTITVVLGVRAFHKVGALVDDPLALGPQKAWAECGTTEVPGYRTTAEQAMQSHHLPPCRACYPGGYIDVRGDEGLALNYYRGQR
jgi:hypothetical protein